MYKNREKERAYNRKKYLKHRDKYIEMQHVRYYANHEENKAAAKRHRDKLRPALKLEVFQYYSKSEVPFCNCCGEDIYGFLTLDHINNDGAEHRKKHPNAKAGISFYRWIKKNGFPEGLQVLCYNCNCSRNVCGTCPHKTSMSSPLTVA